ncbi:MAG: efflux transporter outer membrane subunit [Burkholderiaceae bacterium]
MNVIGSTVFIRCCQGIVQALGLVGITLAMSACSGLSSGLDAFSLDHLPVWTANRLEREAAATPPPIEFTDPAWWQQLNDAGLTALIETGLQDSANARAAAAKVALAQAQMGVLQSNLQPQMNARLEANKQQLSKNYYIPPAFAQKPLEVAQTAGSFNWDLDLWGRQKKAIEAQQGQAAAAAAEQANVSLQLSTQITRAYVQLRWTKTYLAELDAIAQAQQGILDLQTTRQTLGLDDGGAADQAREALAANVVLREQTANQQVRIVNALQSLVGSAAVVADALRRLPDTMPGQVLQYTADQPIPLKLLARRPDLVGMRFLAEAAAKQVDATRLGALPNINLTGFLGLQAIGWDKLLNSGSKIGLLGGVIEFPIFDAGKIRFATEARKAEFAVLKAQYENAVSNACLDIVNEVALLGQLNTEIAMQRERLAIQKQLKDRAARRYELGLDSRIPALLADLQYHGQQLRLLDSQLKGLANQIDLIVALGGGYENTAVSAKLAQAHPGPDDQSPPERSP